VAGERAEILTRRAAVTATFRETLPDWRLRGAGAYFVFAEPPFGIPARTLAQRLLRDESLLVLPGAMFTPEGAGWGGENCLRIAFANTDTAGIAEMGRRLAAFRP
jgi:aspartate/methionine/tyrosine aminotransferase